MSIAALAKGTTVTAKWLARLAERGTDRFKADRDEMFREWTAEVAERVRDIESRMGDDARRVADERSEDREFAAVWRNLGYEASREAIDQRRRMLAYAAAGTLATGHSIAQVSRIERALRQLDPDDILWLDEIDRAEFPECPVAAKLARGMTWDGCPSRDALLLAGCVRELNVWGTGVDVSTIGRGVLSVMEAFVAAERRDFRARTVEAHDAVTKSLTEYLPEAQKIQANSEKNAART